MCGISGFLASGSAADSLLHAAVSAMSSRMQPRGPDGQGLCLEAGVCLGHRRLAILDLEARAAQPMHSVCGRYVIVFNGEIYNFQLLRRSLEAHGHVFHTRSDTEVLLALFATEGEAMLQKLQGMFAFVIWDKMARRGFAARDPYGIKPLYYSQHGDGFLFASQVKALLASGLVSKEPDLHGQAGFWMLGSVPEPYTWFRDIRALPAGHCAWIEEGKLTDLHGWHDIGDAWRTAPDVTSSYLEITERVRAAVRESVQRHLVSDVPVGVFLSGGIDSGALAGMMVEAGARNLQGITIAYDEFAGKHEDEAPVAALIAKHYGIQFARHHNCVR
jgi:asparagine synthase (glutamine-hydrolysing)